MTTPRKIPEFSKYILEHKPKKIFQFSHGITEIGFYNDVCREDRYSLCILGKVSFEIKYETKYKKHEH